ncbi:Uncharacterised protein [uncultured Comamonas sp.]|nr:Uncharacterised protein [uncultured Comamonas sp.]
MKSTLAFLLFFAVLGFLPLPFALAAGALLGLLLVWAILETCGILSERIVTTLFK